LIRSPPAACGDDNIAACGDDNIAACGDDNIAACEDDNIVVCGDDNSIELEVGRTEGIEYETERFFCVFASAVEILHNWQKVLTYFVIWISFCDSAVCVRQLR